jgi:1,4-dihydroxy-2-naphthoyl-CoA hydrolase
MTDGDKAARVLERLNASNPDTLMAHLEMVYSAVGDDYLEAEMPVTPRVHQPMGILHGGATAALAESVGSAASAMRLDLSRQVAVGMELNINHVSSARSGKIIARAEAVHLGRSTHLWDIRVRDHDDRLIAVARLRMMVLDRQTN